MESGLGVAIVTIRMGRLVPERGRLKRLSDGPKPLCIAAGHRADQADDKPLAVFVEELRNTAKTFELTAAPAWQAKTMRFAWESRR